MIRTIYAPSRLSDWKQVALNLKDKFGMEPVYWLCSQQYKQEITETFPGILYQETLNANRGIFPEKATNSPGLTKKWIQEHSVVEREFYLLLNRYDLDGSFKYEDRKRLYYKQVQYWNHVLQSMQIDMVVFAETPHNPSHFIIYHLCRDLQIPTIMMSLTTLPGTLYVKTAIEKIPYVRLDVRDSEKLDKVVQLNTEKMRKPAEKLWYMKKQEQRFRRAGYVIALRVFLLLIPRILEILHILPRKPYQKFYKHRGYPFEESFFTRSEFAFQRLSLRKRQVALKNEYRRLSEEPSLDKKFLYFPLHFQPERSSCPEGSVYADQQLVVQQIAEALPSDTYLYVKEHPSQFMMTRGALGRTPEFYKDLLANRNVKLVDDTFSSRELIEKSKGVVTLTGTAGLEALFRGIPVLVFGYAWYRGFPGVYNVDDYDDMQSMLSAAAKSELQPREIDEALEKVKPCLLTAYVTRWNMNAVEMSEAENVRTLTEGYSALLKHLGYKETN